MKLVLQGNGIVYNLQQRSWWFSVRTGNSSHALQDGLKPLLMARPVIVVRPTLSEKGAGTSGSRELGIVVAVRRHGGVGEGFEQL